MAHSNYQGTFHDYLAHAAVASAEYESRGSFEASKGNMPEALRCFSRANNLKGSITAGLNHAHEGFHEIIGNYGSLAGHSPEVGEFLHQVAIAAERLEDRTHDWHIQGMIRASEARKVERDLK